MLAGLILLIGFCAVVGVGYPLAAAIFYPVYRAMGGRRSFRAYMRDL